jgi:hypothetical protein
LSTKNCGGYLNHRERMEEKYGENITIKIHNLYSSPNVIIIINRRLYISCYFLDPNTHFGITFSNTLVCVLLTECKIKSFSLILCHMNSNTTIIKMLQERISTCFTESSCIYFATVRNTLWSSHYKICMGKKWTTICTICSSGSWYATEHNS